MFFSYVDTRDMIMRGSTLYHIHMENLKVFYGCLWKIGMVLAPDWVKYKPERWLQKDTNTSKLSFVARNAYTYPSFQAGPRICLEKAMVFLQMKRLIVGLLSKFKVVLMRNDGLELEYLSHLTAKMKGGFPVRIEERVSWCK
ncbi:Cytochrome P450 94A1 [Euphorbia peplus]|nr:Cytochrome P450 94A1 [Euphorbia peplus]